jgi:hypothetical protein
MMNATKTHKHTVKTTTGPFGFDGCVAPNRCNGASHGGVRYRDTCSCGAYRVRNSTGRGREEVGPWINV